jgi:hypothetical protein
MFKMRRKSIKDHVAVSAEKNRERTAAGIRV